jgi:hypothetical protein
MKIYGRVVGLVDWVERVGSTPSGLEAGGVSQVRLTVVTYDVLMQHWI